MQGWRGRYLRVDLTGRSWDERELPPETLGAVLGGRGLGAHLLRASGRHALPADDPAVPLIVAPGPLSGTRAPTSSRTSLTTLSPLTDSLFDSNSGGFFGIRLKRAGYDALWIEGTSAEPVTLVIEPGRVRFEPAGDLWGQGNRATQARLAEREGKAYAALSIGPAGESGSLLANIAHGRRFFGRGGVGAAMGRRRLKAVLVRGEALLTVHDPATFEFVVAECSKWLQAHPITSKGLPQFGTAVLMNVMNAVGALPTRNFREGVFPGAGAISGEALRDRLLIGRKACPGCPIACGRKIRLDGREVEGPEFETLWSFGAALGCDDLEGIARLNLLCNDLGIDTISAGSTLAAAREAFEAGALAWDPLQGGGVGIGERLREMATGTGRAALLKDGSRRFAAAVGMPELSMTAKGLELPAYDPRGAKGQGLAYATSNRGGCHLRAYMVGPEILASPKLIDRFGTHGKAGLTIVFQNLNAAVDSLVLCRFTSLALKDEYYARLLRAATGMDIDAQGLQVVGERIYTLERLVNLERGFDRSHDTLPRRLTDQVLTEGPSANERVDLEPMLDEYYRFRGWDRDGVPTRKKLEALGLEGGAPCTTSFATSGGTSSSRA